MDKIINITDNQFVIIQNLGLNLDSVYILERIFLSNELDYTDNGILANIQKLKRKGYLSDDNKSNRRRD